MAKVKNRKRTSADQIHRKRQKQSAKKQLNPFEIHINKEKMRILGKKMKNDKGLPGISKAKALRKRKNTLLNEYKLQHKVNKFIDKRIGERAFLPDEDKIMARFAAAKAKAHKNNTFDMADDMVLTHKGQTLSEIEQFEDPRSDDEESDEERKTGRLEASFVQDAHFGGGVLSNTNKEGAKTHKELIEQLIEESKKRKAERQRIKSATVDLTNKLDAEWKDLAHLMSKETKNEETIEKPKLDDYNKTLRELKFEPRGIVADRLKTEDELAKEEKEKLEKLEAERLERMTGFDDRKQRKVNHRSADDLDDDFVYESDMEDVNMLTYDDQGQSNVEVKAELDGKLVGHNEENQTELENVDVEEAAIEEEEEESSSDSEDSLADLKEDSESEDDDANSTIINNKPKPQNSPELPETIINNKPKPQNSPELPDPISQSVDEELEEAPNDLPFTFPLPESYDSLLGTFQDQSINHQKIILERMIKCNHPSLSQGNKTGLGLLFVYLLQYINDSFTDIEDAQTLKNGFEVLGALMPHIYDLAQLNKENTHNSILEVIKEKQSEYRNSKKVYPGLEVLVYLKMVSLLFSTSDFRHQIVTPCFVFMEQMLRQCKVKTTRDITYGLFVCTLVLEYTSLSNRFLPASVNFLAGILHMAIPKTGVKILRVRAPFNSLSRDLVLKKPQKTSKPDDKLPIKHLTEQQEISEDFKVSALLLTLKLLKEFKDNLKNLPSVVEIFHEAENYLKLIPIKSYPEIVKVEYQQLCTDLGELKSNRKLSYLMLEAKKPKALRLYEPKIVEVFDGKRRKVQSKEKTERDKLMHKLKKETKGALREIRRDKEFLTRVKISQRIKSDKERRARVNKIYSEAASQQSELNALDRKKKRK